MINRFTLSKLHTEKIAYLEKEKKQLSNYVLNLSELRKKYKSQGEKDFKLYKEIYSLSNKVKELNKNTEEVEYFSKICPILKEYDNNSKKAEVYNKYLLATGSSDAKIIIEKIDHIELGSICHKCKKGILIDAEHNIICNECDFFEEKSRFDEELLEFKDLDRITFKTRFCYKKNLHFNKIISKAQYNFACTIIPEDLEHIFSEFKKNKITTVNINYAVVKMLLKKMSKFNEKNMTKYYDFIPYIINTYKGIQAPIIDAELKNDLDEMFAKVEKAFILLIKGKKEFNYRSSFLNFHFVIRKMLEKLGGPTKKYEDLIVHFPLLKNEKLINNLDLMWKVICAHYNWDFVPTIIT